MYDLLIRGGTLVTPKAIKRADIAVMDGKITAIQDEIGEGATTELDARGLHIFPGLIDAHVHFNEPGRSDWEGAATGSAALAAGGGTLFIDMPLNSDPPLLTAKAFAAKKRALEASSLTDFALWGGLTPDNLAQLPELAECGVVGFKAFMSSSGIAEFKAVDDLTLYEGMQIAAQLNLPVAVHAESEALTSELTSKIRREGGKGVRDYLASRPILTELEAINRALLLAQETACDLHVVHVSSAKGVALIGEAKARGQRVTCETCPHYLHFNDEALERLGATAKCAPPLRNETERRALWQALRRGDIDLIASDHSPSAPALKEHDDFFEVWGGIAGVQSSLHVLLNHRAEEALPLQKVAALTSAQPAERFGLANKGRLEPGYDADLSLVTLDKSFTLEADDLLYQHKLSPYIGENFRGAVKQTLLRGKAIFKMGQNVRQIGATFIRPAHS